MGLYSQYRALGIGELVSDVSHVTTRKNRINGDVLGGSIV